MITGLPDPQFIITGLWDTMWMEMFVYESGQAIFTGTAVKVEAKSI